MNKRTSSWIVMLTATLLFIGVILSSQSNARERYVATLEDQKEPDLLVLWRSNHERLQALQSEYYGLRGEYDDLMNQTSQGKVSIETIMKELDSTRVFNGDAPATGPGLEIVFDGATPLVANELLDIINELNNAGAEAISLNGMRLTSRTHIREQARETGYNLLADNMLLTYPLSLKAIGDYNSLYNGLTIVGGIIDKLNSYYINPVISRRENIVIDASRDRENYEAYSTAPR